MRLKTICLFIILFFTQLNASGLRQQIKTYILNDIAPSFEYISRLNYQELNADPLAFQSRMMVHVSFPSLESYLNFSPVFESMHFFDHTSGDTEDYSRLTQLYVQSTFDAYSILVGERRLSTQNGKFISDSSFLNTPQTFRQAAIMSTDNSWHLIYLLGYTPSNSIYTQLFEKGSVIVHTSHNHSSSQIVNFHTYLFEDESDTFSIDSTIMLDFTQSISFTYSYQDSPSIKTSPSQELSSYYYDLEYSVKTPEQFFNIGLRTFGEPLSSSDTGFAAPFSSGHNYDGHLNAYYNQVQSGFTNGQRIYFGSFKTTLNKTKTTGLSWYLFRGLTSDENLGAEIDIIYSDAIFPDDIFWTYKAGYFFKGTSGLTESEFKVWLDIAFRLGDT